MRGRQSTDEPAVAKQPPDSRLLGAKQTAACNSRLNSASLFSATSHMCNSRLIRRLSSGRQSTGEPAVAKQPPDCRLLGAKQTAA